MIDEIMPNLDELEQKSVYVIREVLQRFKKPAILWSIGKDSTTMLALCKAAFFGKIPFPVVHIDTGFKFKEIYEFRKKLAEEWGLNLIVGGNEEATALPENGTFECCMERKTNALQKLVEEHGFDALLVGIRRDEHGIRGKERYFSPRDKEFKWNYVAEKKSVGGDSPFVSLQDPEFSGWNIFSTDFGKEADHVRVHPILDWTEQDVWEYVKAKDLPVVDLYFSKNGKRFRSIGCECCCATVDSNATDVDSVIEELKVTNVPERAGRKQDNDKDYSFQKLRTLGYM
jgi:sulfate adenylyltransferase subunit 2